MVMRELLKQRFAEAWLVWRGRSGRGQGRPNEGEQRTRKEDRRPTNLSASRGREIDAGAGRAFAEGDVWIVKEPWC
jgi:hypothetical protein